MEAVAVRQHYIQLAIALMILQLEDTAVKSMLIATFLVVRMEVFVQTTESVSAGLPSMASCVILLTAPKKNTFVPKMAIV
jgi:hypothetical protein